MRVKHSKFDELRIQVVEEALDRGNVALTARKHGISPYSLYKWVKQYRDEVQVTMGKKKGLEKLSTPQTAEDWEEKYEQAAKLLGEKELEIAILRDLVKKSTPMSDSSGSKMDPERLQNTPRAADLRRGCFHLLLST